MTTTGKVVLGVAVAGAAVLAYEFLKPKMLVTPANAPASTTSTFLGGVLSLGSSVINYFGKEASAHPSPQVVPSSAPTSVEVLGGPDADVIDQNYDLV